MTNKIFTIAAALALTTALAGEAAARDGFYIAARGGVTNQNMDNKKDNITTKSNIDLDYVWMASGALGYKKSWFRVEAEYVARGDHEDRKELSPGFSRKAELENTSYMFNAYIDFMPNYVVSPYIMGGLGWSDLKLSYSTTGTADYKYDKNNFTWALGAGLSVRLNRCLNFDAGYRYLDMGTLTDANLNAHETYAGLRYTF